MHIYCTSKPVNKRWPVQYKCSYSISYICMHTASCMLIKQPTLAVEEKREEGYKGLHSGLTITGLTITHELWYIHNGSDIKYVRNIQGSMCKNSLHFGLQQLLLQCIVSYTHCVTVLPFHIMLWVGAKLLGVFHILWSQCTCTIVAVFRHLFRRGQRG